MEVVVRARNFDVTDSLREYVDKKLRRISRHLPTTDLTSVEVELTREDTRNADHRVIAQATIVDINGVILRAEERGRTPNTAVDAVADTLDRRLKEYKGRVYRSAQARKAGKVPSLSELEVAAVRGQGDQQPPAPEEAVLAPQGRLVRVKRFAMKPMTVEEAAFQMEMLGHDFFLFFNSQEGQFNVLYKREDGDYGLIAPEAP